MNEYLTLYQLELGRQEALGKTRPLASPANALSGSCAVVGELLSQWTVTDRDVPAGRPAAPA